MNLDPAPSPTGTPKLPPWLVPWLQALYPVLVLLAAELALPGPWPTERYITLGAAIISGLLGMSSPGNRKQ